VTAFCSRSDDGGLNFGRAFPIYTSTVDGCGGIHGHVKVAPDGTVYVPNRGCHGVQSLTVSEDGGVTWTVRHVSGTNAAGNAFSAIPPPGILDPSIGIASDGTLYFSWVSKEATDNGSGHAHVAVSHDKGLTWTNDYDLGASQGLHNAVFIEAVAGDSNRAAVGFIGTTLSGDHESNDFKGTWYAFIATTYDGGNTWATVNATPDAPVQREAGIWNEGGNSSLRNLLDFNEITADEKGRVLYGYADGCINDCETGGPNSFSAKATIARQSGGRGLQAAFDPAEPAIPQAACLSGRRDDMASYLRWITPDNGGSAITGYKIYRSTAAPASETLIGHAYPGKTSYNDRSVDPTVSTYNYRIVATNAQGDGPASNSISLAVGPRLETTGACELPGVELIVDPTGDEADGLPQHDITSISMAELKDDNVTGAASKLQFIMKIADLSTIPPGWRWSVRFGVTVGGKAYLPPNDPAGNPQEDWFVSMVSSDGAAPAFTYGSTGVTQSLARFFTTIGNIDSASNATPDGTITLVLPKSAIGNPQPGDVISITLGSVRVSGPSAIPETGGTNETIPDTTGAGSYTLRPANLCLPNTAPVAQLAVTPDQGALPLTAALDGSGSHDPDPIDTIASYTFNFGDGSDDVTQSSPTLTHTFTQTGLYPVKLVVTDSRGKVSSNTDQHLVTVTQPTPTPTPTPAATPAVTVSVSPTLIKQGASATFTVAASNSVSSVTTVKYSMSGTAGLGSDYTLSGTTGQVTIPAGQTSGSVKLNALTGRGTKNKTATMTLQPGSGYTLKMSGTGRRATPPSATVTITH
jgi:PKD repeat protein